MAPRAYWRIQKMPNAFAAPGMISAFSDPIQPNSASVTNCGTSDSWAGIMKVASSSPKSQSRPGNSYLANAKAASESKNSTSTVTAERDDQGDQHRAEEVDVVEHLAHVLEQVRADQRASAGR